MVLIMCLKFKRKNNNDYHKKLNKIDKLFIRIFLSTLLLFCLLICDKFNQFQPISHMMNDNINFVKYSKIFNGVFGNFIPINDMTVDHEILYDIVNYENNVNIIMNYTFDGVYCCESGVVTKIKKTKNQTYEITIKSESGINYIYSNLVSCDVNIYSYINYKDIIGKASYDNINQCFGFNLIIEEKGVFYDYFEKS